MVIIDPYNTFSTDYLISIDTMYLKAQLTSSELKYIYERFGKGYYGNESYEKMFHLSSVGFTMMLHPQFTTNYNAVLKLQTKFFTADYVPSSIMEILNQLNWGITVMHVAFDFRTSFDNSINYKWNTNLGHKRYPEAPCKEDINGVSYYLGTLDVKYKNKRETSINYCRNKKEEALGISKYHRHLYANRIEPRLVFTMDEFPLHNLNHAIVHQRLTKYLFVSDVQTDDGYLKRRLQIIRNHPEKLKADHEQFNVNQKKEMRALAKNQREPLEQYYLDNADKLFAFINPETVPDTNKDIRVLVHPIPAKTLLHAYQATEQYNAMQDEQYQLLKL